MLRFLANVVSGIAYNVLMPEYLRYNCTFGEQSLQHDTPPPVHREAVLRPFYLSPSIALQYLLQLATYQSGTHTNQLETLQRNMISYPKAEQVVSQG